MRSLWIAAAELLCFVSIALAQTGNATLGGTVVDASGAVISGATVTAANIHTGIINTVLTNTRGVYNFASLQTGTYKVSSELSGFQKQVYGDISLGVSQQVRLNFTLQPASLVQEIQVSASADTVLSTISSSIGTVLPEYKLQDLPLGSRNVLDLVSTAAGTQDNTFAGTRVSQSNASIDGMSVSDGRFQSLAAQGGGVSTTTYVSPDLVEEVRIIVSPVDSASGRGVGQVQMSSRAGTNDFRGSVFWTNHNSALDSNDFFANFRGEQKDYLNKNQYGARLGGPIFKNKTFFFVLYEGQRVAERAYITGTVLTADARRGIFRYFPGVANGNVLANTPTVDREGNPVKPLNATGDLRSFSVFGLDPLRPGFDQTGFIARLIDRMPLPNNFEVGDGLNTAGYRWVRHSDGVAGVNRNSFNLRLDHNFSPKLKLSFVANREHNWGDREQAQWPGGYDAGYFRYPRVYTATLVSILAPTLVSETRFGYRRQHQVNVGPQHQPDTGKEALEFLPKSNEIFYSPVPRLFPRNLFINGGTAISESPMYTFGNTLSWLRGQHAFKTGVEIRFASSSSNRRGNWLPAVTLGAGGVAVTGINATGLVGNNATNARSLLTDLAGSVESVNQLFALQNEIHTEYIDYTQQDTRDTHNREFNVFFTDDWKIRPSLTVNLGIRYDYISVPWDGNGGLAAPVGGGKGLFGISGTSFADMYQPGLLQGTLMQTEPIGKGSVSPGKKAYKNDWNNLGPSLGLSWSLPWGGRDKTVLRAGYGISYQAIADYYLLDNIIGNLPATRWSTTFTSASYLDLTKVSLPLSYGPPYQTVPLTDRSQSIGFFDENRVVPYVQNWNLEVQRELVKNLTLEVRYVASKGTKLYGGIQLNDVNIFENGILDAFNVTRAGGNAPLFNQMLLGLNVTGAGVVNGTTITGSQALRINTNTRTFLANGDVGQFADFLNRTSNFAGTNGGILRNGKLPENFFVVNPQFRSVEMHGNFGNSTYHALQLQVTKRLSQGLAGQLSYSWSRAIGNSDSDDLTTFRDGRNRKF